MYVKLSETSHIYRPERELPYDIIVYGLNKRMMFLYIKVISRYAGHYQAQYFSPEGGNLIKSNPTVLGIHYIY